MMHWDNGFFSLPAVVHIKHKRALLGWILINFVKNILQAMFLNSP